MNNLHIRKIVQVTTSEFTGTFFLAFFICAEKMSGEAAIYAISFGLVSLIYTYASISGAQFNPIVTIALLITNNLTIYEGIYCIISQCLGALFAGILSYCIYNQSWDNVGYPKVVNDDDRPQAFVGEMTVAFGLIWIVLNIAKSKALTHNTFYGIAFGFFVASNALVEGGVSGACFNPAIAMLTLLQKDYGDMWVFIFGPLTGSILASVLFNSLPTITHIYPTSKRLLVEFIGTLYISWTVALTTNSHYYNGYLAIGFIVTSMSYHGRHISGGHFNPCITFAVWVRGIFEGQPMMITYQDSILYFIVQLFGAFAGGGLASYVNLGTNNIAGPEINTDIHSKFGGMILVAIFSFGFIITVLHTAMNSTMIEHDDYFGIAIGFMTTACALSIGNIAGGILNPLISFALCIIKNKNINDIWVYIIGDFVGTVVASVMFLIWWSSPDKIKEEDELPFSRNFSLEHSINGDRYTPKHSFSSHTTTPHVHINTSEVKIALLSNSNSYDYEYNPIDHTVVAP